MSNSTKYKLQYPIEVDGRTITEVNIRRPKTRDMKSLDKGKGEVTGSIRLISHLTELTPAEVEEMDGKDYGNVSKIVADFFD